jgi:malonyl CoA-acyl carrier protein transacylase
MIECGPGKVLTGLNRRISRDMDRHNLASVADVAALWGAL